MEELINNILKEVEHIKRYLHRAEQHKSTKNDRYEVKMNLVSWLEEYIRYKKTGISPEQVYEIDKLYSDLEVVLNDKNETIAKLEDRIRYLQGSRGWTPLKKAVPEAYKSYWCTVIDATGCTDTLLLYYTGTLWLVDIDGPEYEGQVVAWSRLLKEFTLSIYK